MGAVSRIRNPVGQVSLSALEDQWQRDATAAAIAGARGVVQMDGPIPPGTPIGRLSDPEWGWIIATILFAWISVRAQQAAAEQLDSERTIRMIARDFSDKGITRQSSASTIARQANAAAGGPLETPDEFNDEIKL